MRIIISETLLQNSRKVKNGAEADQTWFEKAGDDITTWGEETGKKISNWWEETTG